MGVRRNSVIAGVATAAIVGAMVAGMLFVRSLVARRDLVDATPVVTDAQPVHLIEASRVTVPLTFRARGGLRGFEEVTVHAEVDGQVLRRNVDEGHQVKKGDVLFELDETFRRLTVRQLTASAKAAEEQWRQAKANLDVARAQVAEAEAAQQNAAAEFERIQRLRKRDSAVPIEVDRITTNKRQCEARMRMANAALSAAMSKRDGAEAAKELAEAQLDEAVERQKKCKIVSPLDGVVSMVAIEAGEYVRPTQPVCQVIREDRFKLLVELAAHEAVLIRAGNAATVFPDARPEEAFEAEVLRVGPSANPRSKKFPVELVVPNPNGQLMAGMFCEALLPAGERQDVLLLPREAVLERYGGTYCFVVRTEDAEWKAQMRRIRTKGLPGRARDVQVVEGLSPGEQVITTGVEQLRHGQVVRAAVPDGLIAEGERPTKKAAPTP